MRLGRMHALAGAGLVLGGVAVPAAAQVTRFEVQVVESPALEGESYGDIGQFERLRGVAYGAVDPLDPRNADIVNIDLAPTDDRGRVEYATTVEIYRPVDMDNWNGVLFHTVPNRGGAGVGDASLLERGFALVRVGWQGDIEPTEENITAMLPVASNPDGGPVVGRALEEFIFGNTEEVSRAPLSYPTALMDPSSARLTVRRTQDGPRETPGDLRWTFVSENEVEIARAAGYDGGTIYEFVYEARDPIVMGLGFAAMRDVISFLRYAVADPLGAPNPLASPSLPHAALSLGISQSGRYLRDFLYQGFNEDIEGRIVFDGVHPVIAGSRKTFTNYPFAQPGRWQRQHEDHEYPGDQFPFTYTTTTDPLSGRADGLLERCRASDTCPRIIHSDGEAEIWQARASLVVTDAIGRDLQLPDNVRVYLVAGTQHGGGPGIHAAGPYRDYRGSCENVMSAIPLAPFVAALNVALYDWVVNDVEPPPSRFPTVSNGGLVSADALAFPDIPGVRYTGSYNPLHYRTHEGVPPVDGDSYVVLVGAVDEDGNMTHGVIPPTLAAPIGTHTGWNLRAEGFGAGEQCAGAGSFFPFAVDAEERAGDPRSSLAERYGSRADYVSAVRRAAEALVRDRLLLPGDAAEIVRQAAASDVLIGR